MKKTIQCKPVDEIDLVFESGEVITLRFDTESWMYLQEIQIDLSEVFEGKFSITEQCAMVIYAGSHGSVELEKARQLVSNLNLATIQEIINEFGGSYGKEISDDQIKKVMAQFLSKKMK